MADQRMQITSPVEIKDNSKERVAFDLWQVLRLEDQATQDKLLELFARCVLTTGNPSWGLENIKKAVKGGS
jgi:hypothetical protein